MFSMRWKAFLTPLIFHFSALILISELNHYFRKPCKFVNKYLFFNEFNTAKDLSIGMGYLNNQIKHKKVR